MHKLLLLLFFCTFGHAIGMQESNEKSTDKAKQEQGNKQEEKKRTGQNSNHDIIYLGRDSYIKVINGEWWPISKERID